MTRTHFPVRNSWPGTGGDRPTPAEYTITCSCGEELYHRAEDLADPIVSPEEAMEEHLTEIEEAS